MAGKEDLLIERRRFPRIRALYLVTYSAQSAGIKKIPATIGRTLDISSAGTRLEVYDRIDPASELEVEIAVEDRIFTTRGKCIHSSETDSGIYIIGIEFDRLHPEISALIEKPAEAAGRPDRAS